MEHVASIIGHVAWPVVALIIGYWLVKELRGGLISTLFPNGGTLKAGGVEVEVKAAGASLKAAGVEQPAAVPDADPGNAVISDETPYDLLIDAWREPSYAISDLAAQYGGPRDARRIYQNIALLEERGVIAKDIADAAKSLFKARNSARRLPPEQVTDEVAGEFMTNAKALAGYLRLIS